jgi:hypothetical protein
MIHWPEGAPVAWPRQAGQRGLEQVGGVISVKQVEP